jgi:hypothetical protein
MDLSRRITIPVLALLLSVLACEAPVTFTPAPDLNQLNTAVAQTVNAALTLSIVPGSSLPTGTSTSTFTPEAPSLTPTETSTPTAVFTFTPLVPLISVSVATNCRSGPGKVYDYRGALLVGMSAEVLARDPSGNYWYIRNPDSEGNLCWVWGNYATISGNILNLPVYTPPPTPTPTFTPLPTLTSTPAPFFKASLSSLDSCATSWWVDIKLKNNGAVSFKSYSITIKDRATDVTQADLSDGFTDIDGCLLTTTKDSIAPQETYLLSAPAFPYNLAGHELHIILTLCSETGQKGICATDKIDLTP